MKYPTVILICLVTSLFACKSGEQSTNDKLNIDSDIVIPRESGGTDQFAKIEMKEHEKQLTGHYVGNFSPNKINITLYEIRADSAFGFSTVSGNHRPLTGMSVAGETSYKLVLAEPGDDEWDGLFECILDVESKVLSGSWTPYRYEEDPQRYFVKDFELRKTDFAYDPAVGIWPEASKEVLDIDMLYGYMQDELRLMRNEIYARHGYSFKVKDMREYFDAEDWYIPISTDIRDQVTDIEWQNIAMIKEMEEYADEYYDGYGR